jgi:hypothetical protein
MEDTMIRRNLLAGAGSLLLAPALAQAQDQRLQLMFVQSAEGMTATDDTLRLIGVGQQTIYFADRPARVAGHLTMQAFLEEWTERAGPDNFGADPPNASLSVYEPGRTDNSVAIIRISHPRVEGRDLTYRYRMIQGPVPRAGGPTTIFIDWIGVGGGVGPGFHGVGRGARGVGWR